MSSTTLIPPTPEPVVDPAPRPTRAETPGPTSSRRSRVHRLWRGPEADPGWARPALLALLATTAVLYLWGLGASGWANTYYSGAVQAATKSWKAFFYGSTDASNFITIDKTPLSIWPMAISARIFGLSSWSILVPQALEGVAVVAVLHATVKRWFGPGAALVAGAVAALTPVAVLMFRFNNPDALLVLLLVGAAYAMTRALEAGRTRWLVLTGAVVGFAFLTKELQAFLVMPGFGLSYLVAGPPRVGRRIWQLLALGVSTMVAAGWWIAIVQLTPASARPYIGGSQNNSFWNVLFGYNGFGRLTGSETGSVGGVGTQGGQWGPTGWTRLFNQSFGGQASWLIPAALILLVGGLVFTATRRRTDRTRAALLLWGGWLLVTGIAISLGKGIIHEYYTVALVPAIGALIGIGGATMWRHRAHWFARGVLSVAVLATAVWSYTLLERTPDWAPALASTVLVGGIVVAVALLFPLRSKLAGAVLAAGLIVGLAAPTASSLSTAGTAHTGALPTAGPAGTGRGFGPGGAGGPGGAPGGARGFAPGGTGAANGTFGPPPGFGGPGTTGGPGGFPGGTGGATNAIPGGGRGTGGMGGLLNGTTVSSRLSTLLQKGRDGYRWTAAAIGANNAASYQLASGEAIMAIGGFNGSDPAPTLAEFQSYVRQHAVHYFIGGGDGAGGPGGSSGTSSAISTWVAANSTATTVGGVTVYDLSSGAA